MSASFDRVRRIVSDHSGVPLERLSGTSAIDQDIRISGDDIDELVVALMKEFTVDMRTWPWQRFAELSEPSLLVAPLLIWRPLTWPFRGRLFDPSPFERLELGHLARCIDAGRWIEP